LTKYARKRAVHAAKMAGIAEGHARAERRRALREKRRADVAYRQAKAAMHARMVAVHRKKMAIAKMKREVERRRVAMAHLHRQIRRANAAVRLWRLRYVQRIRATKHWNHKMAVQRAATNRAKYHFRLSVTYRIRAQRRAAHAAKLRAYWQRKMAHALMLQHKAEALKRHWFANMRKMRGNYYAARRMRIHAHNMMVRDYKIMYRARHTLKVSIVRWRRATHLFRYWYRMYMHAKKKELNAARHHRAAIQVYRRDRTAYFIWRSKAIKMRRARNAAAMSARMEYGHYKSVHAHLRRVIAAYHKVKRQWIHAVGHMRRRHYRARYIAKRRYVALIRRRNVRAHRIYMRYRHISGAWARRVHAARRTMLH